MAFEKKGHGLGGGKRAGNLSRQCLMGSKPTHRA
jgi:hypothetical protein